jgi:hypothetical protein
MAVNGTGLESHAWYSNKYKHEKGNGPQIDMNFLLLFNVSETIP